MKEALERIKTNLEKLKEYGTPLYVYDYDTLQKRCQELANFKRKIENNLDGINVNMHYSPKANSNPHILKVVKENGLYVDCMSPMELNINQKCGFNSNEILYVCNNIDENEMKKVYDSNLLICLDSISQVDTWGKLYPNTNIMIRINPRVIGVGHSDKVITSGKSTKFGITEENFNELFNVAKKYNLNIIGTHQHLGSLFLNDKIENYIVGVETGIKLVKKNFKDAEIIDLGGGFGVPYKLDEQPLNMDLVADQLIDVLKPFTKEYPSVKEFKFEPGRYIPCEAGYLMGNVTAIKYENEKYWIGTDLGMNQLVRPSMYDSYHEISILNSKENQKKIVGNIVGNVCESGDIMAKERNIYLPNVGDTILVHNAGAYGYSMASNYTGRPRPAEVMLYDDFIELIRKRETDEYLEENIIWPKTYQKTK